MSIAPGRHTETHTRPTSPQSREGLAPEPLKVRDDREKREKRRKRTIRLIAGSAATSVIVGVAGGVYAMSRGGEDTEPRVEPGASAPANPAPSESVPEQSATPDSNITIENLSSYMIEHENTPEDVASNYSDILSYIVSTRLQNNEFDLDKTDDLVYLVDSSNTQLTKSFAHYVGNLVKHLAETEKRAQEQGLAADGVYLGVAYEMVSSEVTPTQMIFEITHDYRAETNFGEYLGNVLANSDPTRFTFEHQDVKLPNGEISSALRMVERFDTHNNQPA